jgi:hypothetical protein
MLKFTSVSGSVRAITDITLTVTLIRTDIIDLITGRTTGMAAIAIIATIIVIPIITGTSLTGIATPGWFGNRFRTSQIFFQRKLAEGLSHRRDHRFISQTSVKPPV